MSVSPIHNNLSTDDLRPGSKSGSNYLSIKKKLQSLDSFSEQSTAMLEDHDQRLQSLERHATDSHDNTSGLLKDLRDKIMSEFKEVQEEMQHKFSLQVAENKRLQSHLTNQKNEMHAMHKRLLALEERVRACELDIGTEDENH